jgi:hypothetical protein
VREIISVDTKRTSLPQGILIPVEVLDNLFSTHLPTNCANTIRPIVSAAGAKPGLMILSNTEGADELIELLNKLGTARSLEIAQLLTDARKRNR